MTDEKNTRNTTPETAKPEPTLTNPVEQSFAEAERLAEQAEAAAKDEPCCDMPKAEEAAPEAPKTEVPTPPQYQPPQYTYAAYTAQPQQPTPQEGAGDYRPPRYTEQYQANANNANYNNPQQTYYAPNGQPQYGQNYAQPYDPPQGTKSRLQPVCSPFYSVCSACTTSTSAKRALALHSLPSPFAAAARLPSSPRFGAS